MADREQIEVPDPTGEAKQKDYDRTDLEHVIGLRDWDSWDELLAWLENEAADDDTLTPLEVRSLAEDVAAARERGARFDNDTESVWAELQRM
jgi:hypothetical protein